MKNSMMVQACLQWLAQNGVREICLCPGGRNSPFVVALSHQSVFQIHSAFDERAAGFFALGRAQKSQSPVAVVVTSGTAVAELLPAVIEAYYTRTPLVIVSADRPRQLRETGAPQTIQQVQLFGSYVEKCVDLEEEFYSISWEKLYSIHLNLCFDEPLLDQDTARMAVDPASTQLLPQTLPLLQWSGSQMKPTSQHHLQAQWLQFCNRSQRPLLMLSTLSPAETKCVQQWLSRWPGWIYAEGPSGLREWNHPGMIQSGDRFVQKLMAKSSIDGVVRVGGVPTARAWRNLEKSSLPVFSLSRLPFSGLSRGEAFSGSLEILLKSLELPSFEKTGFSEALAEDQHQSARIATLLQKYPNSEPAQFSQLSDVIPASAQVYIGNSLPIREWDSFARRDISRPIFANRGANGIDGQLATACGFLEAAKETWAILGDLTMLYDANALWFWQKTKHPLKLVVMNNSGGKIFERLFHNNLFYNEHTLQFESSAAQWGIPYQQIGGQLHRNSVLEMESLLLELVPCKEQTQLFWQEYDSIWGA